MTEQSFEHGLLADDDEIVVRRTLYGVRATIIRMEEGRVIPLPHLVRHSPDGYEYGYAGSGPADLALSILAVCLPATMADSLYQRFKAERIAGETAPAWWISVGQVREWAQNALDAAGIRGGDFRAAARPPRGRSDEQPAVSPPGGGHHATGVSPCPGRDPFHRSGAPVSAAGAPAGNEQQRPATVEGQRAAGGARPRTGRASSDAPAREPPLCKFGPGGDFVSTYPPTEAPARPTLASRLAARLRRLLRAIDAAIRPGGVKPGSSADKPRVRPTGQGEGGQQR